MPIIFGKLSTVKISNKFVINEAILHTLLTFIMSSHVLYILTPNREGSVPNPDRISEALLILSFPGSMTTYFHPRYG